MGRRFSFKGFYKNWYFRSLRELSFVLTCEKNGLSWRGAETDEFAVWYIDVYGHKKKHYPDLFVDNHIVVEVKPTKYQKAKTVALKAEAMKSFCDSKGYVYSIISPRRISKRELEKLIEDKLVTFSDEYAPLIKNYLRKRRDD